MKKNKEEQVQEIIKAAEERGISYESLIKILINELGSGRSIFLHMLKCGEFDSIK